MDKRAGDKVAAVLDSGAAPPKKVEPAPAGTPRALPFEVERLDPPSATAKPAEPDDEDPMTRRTDAAPWDQPLDGGLYPFGGPVRRR